MSWREFELGDGIHVKHGFAFKGEYFAASGEHMVLTPGNFLEKGGFRVRDGKERFYHADFPEDYLLTEGDLIVAMTEQGEGLLGSAARIPSEGKYLHNQRLGLVQITDPELLDKRFLYWVFNSADVRAQIRASATGAKVKHTAPERIKKIRLKVPELSDQQAIAWVLDSYDNLIATNQRHIALLEEAAHRLYREWFVHLRFPGHESVPVKDGVPEGWKKGTAHDFVSILSGGTPKTGIEHYWGGDIPFFTPKDSPDAYYALGTEKTLTESGLASCNSRLFAKETTFITARGTVGKVALAQKPMAMNQSCYALVPKQDYDNLFLFAAIKDAVEHFKQVAVGGVFDAIVVDTFKVIPFVLPDAAATRAFGSAVRPLFQQVETLLLQIQQLAQARDLLLPNLMSGQLDVSGIRLPEEVAA
ncbi:MAG: EcoKI restriction-modification system protein HsdS [Candidatus Accumulibacter phosphatis]|jgi:type I restriction enzyme S subunit|uniref:EcoKI restriction-modification system protein HsdS n=1 Tax=Candidatus Accumulibacter phosphatis TaxID=327160 RepID=A0A080LZ31_9PROT|nr:MAG: EcoKI restriction-modification system protein HsdS [Candidatus Accumulibacter phosphatis]HRF11141.1 restriction endonuclease subunit S [Candidatus Accumulibacter phosphatis]